MSHPVGFCFLLVLRAGVILLSRSPFGKCGRPIAPGVKPLRVAGASVGRGERTASSSGHIVTSVSALGRLRLPA